MHEPARAVEASPHPIVGAPRRLVERAEVAQLDAGELVAGELLIGASELRSVGAHLHEPETLLRARARGHHRARHHGELEETRRDTSMQRLLLVRIGRVIRGKFEVVDQRVELGLRDLLDRSRGCPFPAPAPRARGATRACVGDGRGEVRPRRRRDVVAPCFGTSTAKASANVASERRAARCDRFRSVPSRTCARFGSLVGPRRRRGRAFAASLNASRSDGSRANSHPSRNIASTVALAPSRGSRPKRATASTSPSAGAVAGPRRGDVRGDRVEAVVFARSAGRQRGGPARWASSSAGIVVRAAHQRRDERARERTRRSAAVVVERWLYRGCPRRARPKCAELGDPQARRGHAFDRLVVLTDGAQLCADRLVRRAHRGPSPTRRRTSAAP